MGQAKLRGSFEDRVQQSVERKIGEKIAKAHEAEARAAAEHRRVMAMSPEQRNAYKLARRRSMVNAATWMGLAASMGARIP